MFPWVSDTHTLRVRVRDDDEICFTSMGTLFKGIVSRDWGELQMIPVDSLEVFSIAGSYLYSFLTTFSCLIFKKEEIAVRHLAITSHMRSDIARDFIFLRTIT